MVFDLLGVEGISVIIFVLILLLCKRSKNNSFNPPPGPKGLPIIGNLHQIGFSNSHHYAYFSMLKETYGPIIMLRVMNQPMVVIQSAKLAKEICLTQDKKFCNRLVTTGTKKLSYNALDIAFSPYSDYLKEIKKILSVHLLSSKKVQSYASIRNEEVLRLIQKVSAHSSVSKIVNLSEFVMSFAGSNSGRITSGKRYDDEEMLGSRYFGLLHETEEMFTAFFFSDYLSFGGHLLDKITGKTAKLQKIFNELDGTYEKIIYNHLNSNMVESKTKDIIDVLLGLMNDPLFPFKLTMNHIKAILMDLFIGGANTTTVGLIWAIVELVKNPICMSKVQEELRQIGTSRPKKDCLCIEENDLQTLIYFKAVVKETFRLHPPAPLLVPREAVHKSIVDGFDILPKTKVFINAWAIGRDPIYWKEPEKFMPERFLESSTDVKLHEIVGMVPFGGGRRMCPGFSFGLANLELALANLLYSFKWELPPGLNKEVIDSNVLPGIVMHKKNQLCLVATEFK